MTAEQAFLDHCRAKGIEITERGQRQPLPAPTPGRVHVLWLPDFRFATCNQLMRGSVRNRCRLARIDRDIVSYWAKVLAIPLAAGKRRVTLEIVLTGRQQEVDADGYWKAVNDSLVSCGLLRGDRIGDVELGGVSYLRGGEAGTRIILTDLPPLMERLKESLSDVTISDDAIGDDDP